LVLVVCLGACSKATPPASTAPASKPAATSSSAPSPAVPTPAAATTPAAAPATAAAPAQAVSADAGATPIKPVPEQLPNVVARVNGETITKADLEKMVQNVERNAGGPVPKERRDEIYRALLDRLVGYKLLLQETKARKLAIPDADVNARITQLRAQFPTEDAFNQQLAQQHITMDQLKADARENMVVQKLIEAVSANVSVKPEEIEAFYKNNPENFQQPERVRASHILIQVAKDADAATKVKAKAKAEDLLKQARAGKDFAELARQNSQDPGSAPSGGDLGFFGKGQMVPQFDQVVFSQKPGTISNVVETDFGYHIIKVIEKQPPKAVPFEEAKPRIQMYLTDQAKQHETDTFVNGLKAKSKVEILI
jgi:peptidyl-prolyl cis-trans isomerase C